MNSKANKRLLSLLLVLCLLCTSLLLPGINAFAADTSASGTYAQVGTANSDGIKSLLLYRDFEDGLQVANGAQASSEKLDVELVSSNGNTYYRYSNSGEGHTYLYYDVGSSVPTSGSLVFQFDIMLESASSAISGMVQVNPKVRGSSSDCYNIGGISYGNATNWSVFAASTTDEKGWSVSCNKYTNNRQLSANTWYTVTYVFSGTDMVNSTLVTCYFNGTAVSTTYTDTSDSSTGCTDVRPGQIRFGCNTSGASFCVDDVIIYTCDTTTPATAAAQTVNGSGGSKGSLFNAYDEPYVDPDAYTGNFFFKVGVKAGLNSSDQKVTFTEAPFEYGGEIYIPTSALTTIAGGAPAGGIETVNGISCVNIKNMSSAYSGYYASYSTMGLIGVSTTQDLFPEGAAETLIPVMQKFVFDNISTTLTQQDSFAVGDLTSADHPYLYADQSRFDELAAVWAAGQAGEAVDEVLYGYIDNRVSYAKRQYDQYAQVDSSGNYTAMNTQVNLARGHQDYIFEIPYQTTGGTGGYDVGGRLGEAASNNERILALAYAYQITKDINYAKLAYQYAIYMGQWEHWGPGHFLNVADASSPYAVAYDWLYDAWATLESEGATYLYFNGTYTNSVPQFDTKTVSLAAIESIIFTHSILPGYYTMHDSGNAWYNPVLKDNGWGFYTNENNWNAVCSAGMTVASLALVNVTTAAAGTTLDRTIDGVYNATDAYDGENILSTASGKNNKTPTILSDSSTYQDYCEYLINGCLYYLPRYGLAQYVPDGSYIESNGYWSYGTNNLFELSAALTSATGSHYGLLNAWGLDKTAYFAINTMSSDGLSFNYHDSNTVTPQDTSWFMYLGTDAALGDRALAGIRKDLNANLSQTPSYYDAIYYFSDEDIGTWEYPDLEYYMEGIDGYVVRDSWNAEEGTLYAGIIGNSNNVNHGQIDSGSFVYYNKGTRWFCDLGTEEYNAANFWGSARYMYYAMGGEGNNNLIITSEQDTLPYGQALNGFGAMIANGSNDYGAYAILDNTTAYGDFATSAKRGMLITNDRKTFVIQDEATFPASTDVAWIAHTLASNEIMLSIDGTVAYMSNGTDVIKVTLLDNNDSGLKFTVRDTDTDPILDCTVATDYSTTNGGVAQKSYTGYKRLVIEATGITSLNIAVVIEEVVLGETKNDEEGVGYSFTAMSNWTDGTPTADGRGDDATGGEQGPVASVTVTTTASSELNPDTPIVDLWSTGVASVSALAAAAAEDGETVVTTYEPTSFAELESIISANKGSVIEIKLHASNDTPISIYAPCTVNKNGYELLATSTSYIAQVSGQTVEYKAGSVTVRWVLADGSVVTESYTGSTVASYKGTIVEGTSLYEIDNGDGTYSYYTSGNAWALSENGAQVSGNALIVTSENNTFYQTGKEFDGLFVTVKGSTVTGYYSANDFFTSTVLGGSYDRISVTNDFGYDGTGKNDVRYPKTAHLYLNGNTITFTSSDTSDHMFVVNNGDFYVHGPGAINSQAESSNMFYNDASSGDNIYVENVDLYSVRAIIDLRCNTATFKNCNVTIEKNAQAFCVINRNNAATVNPYLIVDGCNVNMPVTSSGTCVISISLNGTAEITGGTTITTATDCRLFTLQNNTVGTVTGFDYANAYQEMYAIIGEVYHSLTTLSASTTNDSSGTTYDLSGRLFYGEGYTFTGTAPSPILDGLVVARIDGNNFVIADPADCATVVWKNGTTTLGEEYWLAGTTPAASADIKSGVTLDTGNMLSFTTEEVAAGESYTFNAVIIDEFDLKVNMSLQVDFNLNFFIEAKDGMTFEIDGVPYTTTDTESYPGYYKVTKYGINPANAGKTVTLKVTYGGTTVTRSISPIDYISKVLSETTDETTNAMMINIVKYIDAAYVYVGNNVGETAADYAKVLSLYNEYKSIATVAVVDRQPVDTSAVSDAILSAQLNLSDSAHFRFNLKSSYTGTVTIDGVTYSVKNGMHGANGYIEVSVKAYDMLEAFVITTASGTVNYSLANYYYYQAVEQGSLTNLLNALYAYCETAKNYQATLS